MSNDQPQAQNPKSFGDEVIEMHRLLAATVHPTSDETRLLVSARECGEAILRYLPNSPSRRSLIDGIVRIHNTALRMKASGGA